MTKAHRIGLKLFFTMSYLWVWYLMAQSWSWVRSERGELVASIPFLIGVVLLIVESSPEEYDSEQEK